MGPRLRLDPARDTIPINDEVDKEGECCDRETKERKMIALMVNDLGIADMDEAEMKRMNQEVGALDEEELNKTLASRVGLAQPVDEDALEAALQSVEEPERASQEGPDSFTGAPDMSHEARPEERES